MIPEIPELNIYTHTPILSSSSSSSSSSIDSLPKITRQDCQFSPLVAGITQTAIQPPGSYEKLAINYTAFPLSDDNFDLEWEKIDAITWKPIRAITCTVFFNLLQNIFSIFSTMGTWIPKPYAHPIALALSIIDIPASSLQNVRARALKTVNRLLELSTYEKNFLYAIERQIKISDKTIDALKSEGKFQKDLITLVTLGEYQRITSSDINHDFYYALKMLAKRYRIALHILCINPEVKLQTVLDYIPKKNTYDLLAYSTAYYPRTQISDNLDKTKDVEALTTNLLSQHQTLPNAAIPPLSLYHYWSESTYRDWVKKEKKISELCLNFLTDIPEEFFIVYWPYIVTMLQAITMLVEVLDKLFDLECNTFAGRIAIIISALYIGYLRADVTYHMKGDVALERCQELFKKTEEKQALRNGRNDIKILFSYADTWEKKQAILCYHLYPRLLKLAGIIIAAFTVYNYFGIALFSSGKGLIYILETLQKIIPSIPVPEQNDYGIWWYAAFGLISAIALAALNGLFNQGWDAYQRFKKWAKEEEKRLDAFIENRPYSSPKSEDWGIGYTLITATIFDSIFASLTAGTGVQLATEAGCSIHALAFLFCWQQFVIPLLVIFCIFWSQTNYALTLYKRDNTLWEKIFAKYTPTCLKEERDTCYPYTEGHPSAFDTTHSIFHRRDVETMTVSHEAAPSVGSVGSPPVISYNVGMR